jgi:hypothetical protein
LFSQIREVRSLHALRLVHTERERMKKSAREQLRGGVIGKTKPGRV